jgi:hypothetical protein
MREVLEFWLVDYWEIELPGTRQRIEATRTGEDIFSYAWAYEPVEWSLPRQEYVGGIAFKPASFPQPMFTESWTGTLINPDDTITVESPLIIRYSAESPGGRIVQ